MELTAPWRPRGAREASGGVDPRSASPLRDRSFRWYFLARTVSVLGSAMTPVALAFAVLQLTRDAAFLGYVLAAEMVPMVGFILLGGGIADRCRRDTLLLITNIGAGLSQGAVATCVLTHRPVGLLIPLAAVNGTLQAFSSPAMQGIVAQLTAHAGIQRANSLLASSRNAARVFGPTVAGVLVAALGGGWAIAIDAASFLISAACLTHVCIPPLPAVRRRRLLHELGDGWAYFRSTSWLWSITLAFAMLNTIQIGVWQVLGPLIARQSFGAGEWGLVLSIKAIGLLFMSTLMLRLVIRRPLSTGMLWMSLTAIPLVLLGAGTNICWLSLAAFASGLGSAYLGIVWDTTRQLKIPAELISRATSYDDFGAFATIPIGQLTAVPLATAFGAGHVAIIAGISYFLIALAPIAIPSVRNTSYPASA